ncbi:MAG TPA: hypothetical protein VMB23_03135 [Spirochaetia bacterium]|jgi:hypothetical protein|nr:hypothetical protein [Spirochaetia bacterium]
MQLNQIADIVKKKVALHYRNEYSANAVFDLADGKSLVRRIEFVVEMSPLGSKDIRINFVDPIDYPLVPVLKSLKDQITVLDRKGSLL